MSQSSSSSRSSSESAESSSSGSSDRNTKSSTGEDESTVDSLPEQGKKRKKRAYNMPTARVSAGCKAVLFPEQSSSCEESDVDFTELLSSILYKRQSATAVSEKLLTPLKHKPMFPGLAEALKKKKEERKLAREKSRKPARSVEIPDLPTNPYEEFTYTPVKLTALKERQYHQSDAWLYDSKAHILALTDIDKLSSFGNLNPGLERGLPIKYDDGRDMKFLIRELAALHTVVRPGNKLMKEALDKLGNDDSMPVHPITELQPLYMDAADADRGIFEGDLSFGITGARFFGDKNDNMFKHYLGKGCSRKKESKKCQGTGVFSPVAECSRTETKRQPCHTYTRVKCKKYKKKPHVPRQCFTTEDDFLDLIKKSDKWNSEVNKQ